MSLAVGLFTAVAVAGALIAVSLVNILHAVLGLAISLLGVAGLFFCLGSPFVAAMEVLVYVGGISVAMVFAVMMSRSISAAEQPRERWPRKLFAATASLAFFAVVGAVIHTTSFDGSRAVPIDDEAWSVKAVGHDLLTHYNLVFEALSVVLLLGIVGAIVISRKEPEDEPRP